MNTGVADKRDQGRKEGGKEEERKEGGRRGREDETATKEAESWPA